MILKSLVTGLATSAAAAAVVTAAAAGVTSMSSMSAAPAIQPVVLGIPLPLDPADVPDAGVPSTAELQGLLTSLANPGVPFRSKANLIEGGVGIIEGRAADRLVAQSVAKGGVFPLSFNIVSVTPAGPGAATANVTAVTAAGNPTTQAVTFINQGSWKLSRASAMSLLQSAAA